jgi:hypothetical protein
VRPGHGETASSVEASIEPRDRNIDAIIDARRLSPKVLPPDCGTVVFASPWWTLH